MELAIRHTAPEDRDASLARRIAAGRLHHQAGDIDRAADVYEALLDELPPGKLRAEVLYADALTQRPDVPHRIALCEEALAFVGDDDVLATDVLGYLAVNRWFGGEVVAGLENARAALSRAEGVGDPRLVATAIARVGWLEAARLDPTRACSNEASSSNAGSRARAGSRTARSSPSPATSGRTMGSRRRAAY